MDKRQIKFRVWNGRTKHMVPDATNDLNDYRRDVLGGHEIMQYIGMNDKNDVEIYEGDVVVFKNDTPKLVHYCNKMCCYKLKNMFTGESHSMIFNPEAIKNIEVVDNIYKHRK